MKRLFVIFFVLITAPSLVTSQPRIDPAVTGKAVNGDRIVHLKVKAGDVFHYRTMTKSQVSIKNNDDLLKDLMPDLKANDKALFAIGYYITASVRSIREDGAADFLLRVDSIHLALENDGTKHSFTSTQKRDRQDSLFSDNAVYAGYDFGLIVDTLGNFKDVYGAYNVTALEYKKLDDSLQTDDNFNELSNQVFANVRKIARYVFNYLREDSLVTADSSESSTKENQKVWSTIVFPMQKDFKEKIIGFEERNGRTYVVSTTETTMIPTERILDEKEYSTTLPTYSYIYKGTDYIDASNGMLTYNRWSEERSYSLKIESKLPEKAGKSFATVQRSKVETIVELLK